MNVIVSFDGSLEGCAREGLALRSLAGALPGRAKEELARLDGVGTGPAGSATG